MLVILDILPLESIAATTGECQYLFPSIQSNEIMGHTDSPPFEHPQQDPCYQRDRKAAKDTESFSVCRKFRHIKTVERDEEFPKLELTRGAIWRPNSTIPSSTDNAENTQTGLEPIGEIRECG